MASARPRFRPPPAARPDGPPVGRSFLPGDAGPIIPRPVVIRRELVVEQLVGAPSAPPIRAVAPAAVSVDNSTALQIEVEWVGTGTTTYKLWHQTVAAYDAAPSDAKWDAVTAIDVTGTGPNYSHTLTGLTGGVEYYIVASAVVSGSESPRSPLVAVRALHPAPAAPQNVAVTLSRTVEGQMTLNWDAVADADLYYPQIQLPGESIWRNVGLPRTTRSASFNGQVGSTYKWRVRADREHALDGVFSAEVEATPVTLLLDAPGSVQVQTNLQLQLVVSWQGVAASGGGSVLEYSVERRETGTETWTAQSSGDLGFGPETSLTIPVTRGLWDVRVRARNAAGWGPYSQLVLAAPVPGAASTTTTRESAIWNVQASRDEPPRTQLSWNYSGGTRGITFEVQVRSRLVGGPWSIWVAWATEAPASTHGGVSRPNFYWQVYTYLRSATAVEDQFRIRVLLRMTPITDWAESTIVRR